MSALLVTLDSEAFKLRPQRLRFIPVQGEGIDKLGQESSYLEQVLPKTGKLMFKERKEGDKSMEVEMGIFSLSARPPLLTSSSLFLFLVLLKCVFCPWV